MEPRRLAEGSRCNPLREGLLECVAQRLRGLGHGDGHTDAGQARRVLEPPPFCGDAYVVGQPVSVEEVARRPRKIGRNRSDEQIVWGGGEPVNEVRFSKLEQMARMLARRPPPRAENFSPEEILEIVPSSST